MIEAIFIPVIAIAIAPFIRGKGAAYLSALTFLASFVFILADLVAQRNYTALLFNALEPVGKIYLLGDTISHAFGFTIAIVSAMVALYSYPYMKHRFEEMELDSDREFRKYWFLYNLYAASMLWLVYAGNLLLIYVFFEISLIASFLLIYYYGYGNRVWVALLYFVWANIAGVLALVGFLMVGFDNGTMALDGIASVSMLAWLLIFLGMIVKLPGLGPHVWLPWAHAEAPTPVSALLSPLTVGLAAFILIRVYLVDPSFILAYRWEIFLYGVLTSVVAGFAVFKQTDHKKLLAYSTVSQMGYILIAFALGTAGIVGVVIQYISHAFGKSILFMSAGAIIAAYHGLRDVEKMGGLHEQIPTIANAALLGFMNLSGILAIGMIGEFFILKGLVDTFGLSLDAILLVVFVFIISGLYSFYTMKRIYYGKVKDYEKVKLSRLLDTPLYVIGALSILFILPPLATWFVDAVVTFLGGGL
ncbi:Formate hydrogenlyase subunit 3/Multisubunit Na+/H+ antiporter, MnhD subunit [Geoglobus ahangari]|uniref:Formate hydrogenlyase subunit 3/Multisubunit Na+/H+ antiporter, MnhD subunit n=1 Tax=Geoglobus ahangari TaxID=113653 RepID=A0A0F7IF83_9EURY|nr:complex I subunit 5 family protein [Geoglobus ahangari]AKG92302.1 Formate hydrogenlyase subunit 3/Multisubunit Na+/H+ antiporter, MnhD subunit [Geoglobus ahangari]